MKIIPILILAIYQVFLALKWLAQMTWWLLVTLPWGIWRDAQRWRQHECPKPQPVAVESFVPDSEPAPAPVGNDDSDDPCWFCSHAKTGHTDDYACTECECEAEQYARAPIWHPGDPMPYRKLIRAEDGTFSYEGEYA